MSNEAKDGYWYCPYCQSEVDARTVTFEEKHDVCGSLLIAYPAEPLSSQGMIEENDDDWTDEDDKAAITWSEDNHEVVTDVREYNTYNDLYRGYLTGLIAERSRLHPLLLHSEQKQRDSTRLLELAGQRIKELEEGIWQISLGTEGGPETEFSQYVVGKCKKLLSNQSTASE